VNPDCTIGLKCEPNAVVADPQAKLTGLAL